MTGKNHIVFSGEYVHRPSGLWTVNVHKLLHYLHEKGFQAAPLPIGFDKLGREIITYVKGNTGEFPDDEYLKSGATLCSAAKLLRQLHDISIDFLVTQNVNHQLWRLGSRAPVEVICHGDFAPYNVVYQKKKVIGIIDFDCAHPGTRAWDLAYAIYRWAPLTGPTNPDGFGSLEEQLKRAKLFIDAYELEAKDRALLTKLMIERLAALVSFMFNEANKGNEIMQLNISDGHHLLYQKDMAYIKQNKLTIQHFLSS